MSTYRFTIRGFLTVVMSFTLVGPTLAQGKKGGGGAGFQDRLDAPFIRNTPVVLGLFRPVVADPTIATVRVLCDGKDTALGMIIAEDGWILTKANDLAGEVVVQIHSGKKYPAQILGVNLKNDLAVLKIDEWGLKPITFSDSKTAEVGDWIACVGMGQDPVAVGVVSVATRNIPNAKIPPPSDPSKSGYLGVYLTDSLNLNGAKISDVQDKGPAATGGVKKDDIVVAVNGATIHDADGLMELMQQHRPGEIVALKIHRGDADIDLKVELGKRPPQTGSSRSDQQNRMGSELSTRTSGYPVVLQHDAHVKNPNDCGGPLVDLDGKVIGINICRAGRTESWAVPAEVIVPLLPELKSGRVAPKSTKTQAADEIIAALQKRLNVVDEIAKAKWNAKETDVTDAEREKAILATMQTQARKYALAEPAVRSLFEAQFAAAKKLQQQRFADWQRNRNGAFENVADLKTELRTRIDDINVDLLKSLAHAKPFLQDSDFVRYLAEHAAEVFHDSPVPEAIWTEALKSLRRS